MVSSHFGWPQPQRTFCGSRPSGEAQYGEHVASTPGTSHKHDKFSQRRVASSTMRHAFPARRPTKRTFAR